MLSQCPAQDSQKPTNLEMEAKYLMKTDVFLNPNILRTKNDEKIL